MVKVDNNVCDRCGTCVAVCPTGALRLVDEIEVAADTCSGCGVCVKICPFAALVQGEN